MNEKDFPILKRKIGKNRLVYLDNAASSQKPQQVIDALVDYYTLHNANVHRGIHTLSEEATNMFEGARKKIAHFIGASHPEEIIFTKGASESLNRVAFEWGIENIKEGDVILTTLMEHHSNLVPWQIVAERTGATLKVLDVNIEGQVSIPKYQEALKANVKLVALTQASNVMGTILPIKKMTEMAHKADAVVVVDGAQAIPHLHVNVKSLDCDFYCFSGHKMLGPTGIGVMWGKKELLEEMPPYEYGGGMIHIVTKDKSTWAPLPEKLEAGTPNIAGVIGLGAAVDYLSNIGMQNIRDHEIELNEYALKKLPEISGLTILGPKNPKDRTGLISFTVEGLHGHDIASVLNSCGVAVRSGHHCAQPLHKNLNIPASTRASYYLYNNKEDIDVLYEGILKAIELLK